MTNILPSFAIGDPTMMVADAANGEGNAMRVRLEWAAACLLGAAVTAKAASPAKPTAADAKAFIEAAEARLLELGSRQQRASWVQATYITQDTEKIAAEANKDLIAATVEYAVSATRFDGLALPEDVARKLKLLKLSLSLPAPRDAKLQTELTDLVASLEGLYGKGKYCPPGKECQDIGALSKVMAESRNPDELLEAWRGWHTISPPMKPKYERFVELANQGARTLGFADMGTLWRSTYDMPPDEFSTEVERIWQQVKPLYVSLHAYVRTRLAQKYGPKVVPPEGPIPAHLLGNMWAQSWENVYPLVAPPQATPSFDLTALLEAQKMDARGMVRSGERFFTSLGFEPLPKTFWERSLFTKPADREVVCHASAWDVDNDQDLRIKMCIEVTGEDFVVIHHELGHNFYQRAYRKQPYLFLNGANEGFHEAIGDTIALSVTPEYLVKVGLLDKAPDASSDIGLLLDRALQKVAFLPFGLILDQWRWKVFSGEVTPATYNQAWWDLRLRYQGVVPPIARSEADFDPGAKYHVPGNVSYTRYFLAHVLQFQFHQALCEAAGQKGPLHRCSIYDNKAAGAKLEKMLAMGQSRPWPDALFAMTGQRRMDASALLAYFAPLQKWLDEQNRGQKVGW
jgi:peptidyl-dipeptidase A